MILLTGATGSNGTEILKRLAARNIPVRAMTRDPRKLDTSGMPNVEAVAGDFDQPETLRAALDGVERAFLLTNSTEHAEAQQLAFVEAAKESGLKHLVKLSQFAATPDSPVRFLRYHAAVEAAIQEADIPFTFLRPNLFMQGLLNFASVIQDKSMFFAAAGDTKVSVVDVRDIADTAVAALTGAGHENKVYTLTGPEALSHAEMAAQLSDAVGRTVTFVDVPEDAMRDAVLQLGMPPWQAEGLIEDYAHYRRGEASEIAPGVRDATGNEPRRFADFAQDYAGAFS